MTIYLPEEKGLAKIAQLDRYKRTVGFVAIIGAIQNDIEMVSRKVSGLTPRGERR